MKQIKTILVTSILLFVAFGSVVYTSCRRDRCKNLICQNGGTCSDGFCICPQGYTGTYCQTANVSSIGFKNKAFTPVKLTVNNAEYTVDTGKTITFTGSHGDTLTGFGSMHGVVGVNVDIPTFKVVFPVRGTLVYDLDASSEYFFLMATLNNPTVDYLTQVKVSSAIGDTILDITHIDNDSNSYYIGYYPASALSFVRLEKTPHFWNFSSLNLPMTKNQFYNAVID